MRRAAMLIALAAASACSFGDLDGLSGADAGGSNVGLDAAADASDAGSADDHALTNDSAPLDAGSRYAAVVLADGPSAYWRLGEPAGAVSVADVAGGHTGVMVGAATTGAPGLIAGDSNGAAKFDGSESRINMGDVFDFAGTGAFSVEAWVSVDSMPGQYAYVAAKFLDDSAGRQGWEFVFDSPRVLKFQVATDDHYDVAYTDLAADTTSHHVVGVRTATAVTLYVDGRNAGSTATSNVLKDTTADLVVGRLLRGVVDEVALYPFALTPVQVAAHYTAGR